MKKLRSQFERFCFRHRSWGIPNLMLYISIGNALVYLISMMFPQISLYEILCFDKGAIFRGEVWRLVTCLFVSAYSSGNLIFAAVSLLCYYSLGLAIENTWGTFRFNLFYFTGIVLMEICALALFDVPVTIDGYSFSLGSYFYGDVGSSMNFVLFLTYATLYPDARFLLLFFIPVKAWIFALFYLVVTVYDLFTIPFPHNLTTLISLVTYLVFVGADVKNLIPVSWRANLRRLFRKKSKHQKAAPIPFAGSYEASTARVKAPYNHRCTVCGKTDISHPDMEFRYCSRCQGYHCYCQEHINNHSHITD